MNQNPSQRHEIYLIVYIFATKFNFHSVERSTHLKKKRALKDNLKIDGLGEDQLEFSEDNQSLGSDYDSQEDSEENDEYGLEGGITGLQNTQAIPGQAPVPGIPIQGGQQQ